MFARRVTHNYAYSQLKYELWLSDYERLKFEIQAVKDIDMATWDKHHQNISLLLLKLTINLQTKYPNL